MRLKLCCELISWLCCVATSVSAYFRVLFSLIVRKTVSIVTDFKARHKEDRKKGFVSQINLWHNSHLFWHNSTSFLAQQIGRARLNSSHVAISYAVFCLKKKKKNQI